MTPFTTQARQMIEAGATWAQIGAAFGITPDAARMRGQRRGLRTNRVGRAVSVWTPEFVASVRAGMEGGASVAEMARAAGMRAEAFRMGLRRCGSGGVMEWTDRQHGYWSAMVGEERQGAAAVGPRSDGRHQWIVDMLPGDAEAAIIGEAATLASAKAAAERQVAAWPTLIEGARRV